MGPAPGFPPGRSDVVPDPRESKGLSDRARFADSEARDESSTRRGPAAGGRVGARGRACHASSRGAPVWRRLARSAAWTIPLGAIFLARPSRAGNDNEFIVGNRAAMLGGTGLATVDDGSATWYNPAGLVHAQSTHVDVSASVYALRLYSAP